MNNFFKQLFSDDNYINEKSVVGFIAFIMLVIVLIFDIIAGILGYEFRIHQFVFDGFMVLVLGSFGISSIDKWLNKDDKNK